MKFTKWYSHEDAPQGVPIIDFKKLLANKEEQKVLLESLENSGLFYLKNFGISEEILNSIPTVTESFFKLDDETKEKMISHELPLKGYTPLKKENLSKMLGLGDEPDLCMKYSWSMGKNISPNQNFYDVWQSYFVQIEKMAKELLTIISQIIPQEHNCSKEDWQFIIDGDSTLRHLYYPDLIEQQKLSMAPHSDLGSITLLYQTPSANKHVALEALINNQFVKIPAIRETLVVNFGDILQHVTQNFIKATKHRVVHSPKIQSERTSTIYFYLPHRDLNLKKFQGGHFAGLLTEDIQTFGELIDKNANQYLDKY